MPHSRQNITGLVLGVAVGFGLVSCQATGVTGAWVTSEKTAMGERASQRLELWGDGNFTLTKPDQTELKGKWVFARDDKLRLVFDDLRIFPRTSWFQFDGETLVQLRALKTGAVIFRRP